MFDAVWTSAWQDMPLQVASSNPQKAQAISSCSPQAGKNILT